MGGGGVLNAGYKKEAIRKCEEAGKAYKIEYENTIKKSTELHENKERAVRILKDVETFINLLANKPREIEKIASEVAVRRNAFEKEVEQLAIEAKEADKMGKGIAGGGLLAGAGVAAFGPTAAMGIATTFGTASTGTAIATLAGAAQTNAALAWLGGGALTAGGAGMAGGQAFLAMAGPVGWAIGGAALVGGGLLANSKNKKIAEKAEVQTREIKTETMKLSPLYASKGAATVALISFFPKWTLLFSSVMPNSLLPDGNAAKVFFNASKYESEESLAKTSTVFSRRNNLKGKEVATSMPIILPYGIRPFILGIR